MSHRLPKAESSFGSRLWPTLLFLLPGYFYLWCSRKGGRRNHGWTNHGVAQRLDTAPNVAGSGSIAPLREQCSAPQVTLRGGISIQSHSVHPDGHRRALCAGAGGLGGALEQDVPAALPLVAHH
eukprot:COSAG04_NODE_5231_length_1693_cov_2.159975_3_plen_123_part_01